MNNKGQLFNLLDVYVLGPMMIKAAKGERGFLKWGLLIAGVATVLYSSGEFKRQQETARNEDQNRT